MQCRCSRASATRSSTSAPAAVRRGSRSRSHCRTGSSSCSSRSGESARSSSSGRPPNVRVVCGRAEEQADGLGRCGRRQGARAAACRRRVVPAARSPWRRGRPVRRAERGRRPRSRVGWPPARRRSARGARRAAPDPQDRIATPAGLPTPRRVWPANVRSPDQTGCAGRVQKRTPPLEGRGARPPPTTRMDPSPGPGCMHRAPSAPILCRFRGVGRGVGRPTPKKECSSGLTHLRAREPEGRRREDDDCGQPRRLSRRGGRACARHRPRPAGERDLRSR